MLYPRSGCAAGLEICPQSKRDVPKASGSHSAVDFAPSSELPICALHCHALVATGDPCTHTSSKPVVDGYKIINKDLINATSVLLHDHVVFTLQASVNGSWLAEFSGPQRAAEQYGQAANFREGQKEGIRKLP